jgi:hypothetical protein
VRRPILSAFLALLLSATGAAAAVRVTVDKAAQRMTVSVDGQERYSWPVSTGASGYATPSGAFAPNRMEAAHFSKEWDDAPMPHSIFFTEAGHAIHGSRAVGRLGSPASHGCVRLAPGNARLLFALVRAQGMQNTTIEVTGDDPVGTGLEAAGPGAPLDAKRLTSFNPLTMGIMAEAAPARRAKAP